MPLRKKPLPRKRTFRKNVKEDRAELNPAKFKDHIEVIGKTVLGIVAFCYAVGILVESLYLGSFGVYHVSLFRFTYVFAGVWVLLIYLLPLLPIFIVINYSIKIFPFYGRTNSLFLVMILFLILTSEVIGIIELRITLDIAFLELLILSSFSGTFIYSLYPLKERDTLWNGAHLYLILTGIMLASVSIGLFATHIFPQISARVGGGKPLTVQLLLEVNKENAWMIQKNFDLCESDKARIAKPEENQLVATKPMPLLMATDNDYIIRKDRTTAISISRDQVKTVLYLDNFDYSRDVCGGDTPPKPAGDTPPAPAS